MEKSFSVILCELRKERGYTQKEVAARLGVSQALFSHYEKGIRECGHSFLVKVADFYGVTCDYLLGRSPDPIGSNDFSYFFENENTDALPMRKTLIKAIGAVFSELTSNGKQHGIEFNEYVASVLYKLILLEAKAGNLPANWAGRVNIDGDIKLNSFYLDLIDEASLTAIHAVEAKDRVKDKPVPEALKTIVSAAENQIIEAALEKLPPIPLDFVK